ncbi:type VI secretion system-associated protein TagO [Bradyrhizobium lablabi]|uniref:type VI secretion system-associated protein TagO n=1 Tax=Bradyrhizobium lablabi TaxID=722472 RepID=UPI001BACB18C|nr:type VI secretion system-associated protein TagO [Bradyrhizobium lablabi]MBR0695032.1 hypothetical protein [Bradyrhizobium lablabi]
MKIFGAVAAATLANLSQLTCAHAGDNTLDRLKGCTKLEGMERLKCVDELLGEAPEPTGSTSPQGPNWVISETTSPVDYKPQVAAQATVHAPSKDAPSTLGIHCRSSRTELTLSTAGSWKQNSDVKVVYQINTEPPVEQRWKIIEGGKSLVFSGDVVRLLRTMPDGGRLVVKVYAGQSPPQQNTFQLAGLEAVRRKIAAACNWPPS